MLVYNCSYVTFNILYIHYALQDDFTAWDYLVMGVYGLIVVISLFGNGLVFSVIIRTRSVLTIITLSD